MTLTAFITGLPLLWGLIHPRAIDRFRPVLIGVELGLFIIGGLFWLDAQLGGDSFSPETWGEWACQFPAEMWAGAMIAGSTLCVSGLMHPVTRGRIILGSLLQTAHFLALALSAMLTDGQFVIAAFALILLAPMHAVLAWEAAVYEPGGNP